MKTVIASGSQLTPPGSNGDTVRGGGESDAADLSVRTQQAHPGPD